MLFAKFGIVRPSLRRQRLCLIQTTALRAQTDPRIGWHREPFTLLERHKLSGSLPISRDLMQLIPSDPPSAQESTSPPQYNTRADPEQTEIRDNLA